MTTENSQELNNGDLLNDEDQDRGSTDEFNAMMGQIIGKDDKEGESDDPDILRVLEDIESSEEYGPPIVTHVALAFNRAATRSVSKESLEKLKAGIKVPENCKAFRVPKINPEIWQNLRTKPKFADIKLQQVQAGLSTSLSVLANVADEIAKGANLMPKDLATNLMKKCMDGANLIGSQMFDLSARRRQDIKPFLNSDYAGICSAKVEASEFLFGDNLPEALKNSKAAALVMKNVSSLPRNRFQPYPISVRSPAGSLNYQRPSTAHRGKWNGHQYQQQRSQFQTPQHQRRWTPSQFPQTKTFNKN